MTGVALLDVNLLVALFNPDHVHHDLAHDWFADHREHGWATCPITETGAIRLLTNPAFWDPPETTGALVARLHTFCASGHHRFWPATLSLRDSHRFDLSRAPGYRQLTDIYLLGLAVENGGQLATLDQRLSIAAVKGATAQSLAVLAA